MKRTPIVLGGTLAGLIGVLTFHTTPTRSGFTTIPAASAGSGTSATQGASAPAPTASPAASAKTGGAAAKPTPASTASTTRTATGPQVDYNYGILSVKVTVSGSKITNVGIASIDDGGSPRSQMIDEQSIPILEQEVLQAQSANIQGVSGASYTSAGFVQSLQAALHSLGVQ